MPASVVVAATVLVGHVMVVEPSADVPVVRVTRPRRRLVAGEGASAGVGALTFGVRPRLVASVADDPEGQECVRRLAARGVDVEAVTVVAGGVTGTVTFEVDEDRPIGGVRVGRSVSPPRDGWGREVGVGGHPLGSWGAPCPGDPGASDAAGTAVGGVTRGGGRHLDGSGAGGADGSGEGPRRGPGPARRAVQACRPGDAFVVDTLSWDRALVDAAYEADLQIVADLFPFPRFGSAPWPDVADLGVVDVAVVDEAGALALAESGAVVGSVVVLAGAQGASWDGEVVHHAAGRSAARVPAACEAHEFARGVFCGRLAAALASGDDRPEALESALDAWWRVVVDGPRTVFDGRDLDLPDPGCRPPAGPGDSGGAFSQGQR